MICPNCKKQQPLISNARLLDYSPSPLGACSVCKTIVHTLHSRCDKEGCTQCDDEWRRIIFETKP